MKHSKDYIIWLDEVGRWPLAGPVAVGGVFCLPWFDYKNYSWASMITDSKQLNHKKREYLTEQLLACPDIIWATSFVSAKYIDRHGIVTAIRKASQEVTKQIIQKTAPLLWNLWRDEVTILLDGKTDYGLRMYIDYKLETIIKWDASIWEIGAASIIAKVQRDEYMVTLAHKKKYQSYAFDRHKGYGTLIHRNAIAQYGLSDQHRKSFCKNINTSNNLLHDHWSDQ